jgi:hypothetical protein
VLGCPICWNTDHILRKSSCSYGPLHASFCGQLDWTLCRIPHRNRYVKNLRGSFDALLCEFFATILTGKNRHGLSKNPEYQWRFCHCIYWWDADVIEATLFWLVAGHWILPSHLFKIQWCDWLVILNPLLV